MIATVMLSDRKHVNTRVNTEVPRAIAGMRMRCVDCGTAF
jgi:hypothetical protein